MEYQETLSAVDWSRAQFALTAMYHWIFVPLTLGLGFICAIMETMYFRTGDQEWKRIAKFWMRLFAINFAIGVATGIILEFEFGTNWSNYSYFVGDIFGAPLAIEGIFAFFMEATFMAVMYFGWEKVSKRFHLMATWLTAIGANLSAVWILVANSWMQYPVGMQFNIETARNEMVDFWAMVLSDVSVTKFFHSVTSGYLLAAVFVVSISAWYLLKNRNVLLAKRSIKVAAIWGMASALIVAWAGDSSGYVTAKTQPMKFAAMEALGVSSVVSMEALYDGGRDLPLTVIGVVNSDKEVGDNQDALHAEFAIPNLLSMLTLRGEDKFIPGINDLILGNEAEGILSTKEKMSRGKVAIEMLNQYNVAKSEGNSEEMRRIKAMFDKNTQEGAVFFENHFKYFGYGFFDSPLQAIPNISLVFYSFRVMVGSGVFLLALFAGLLFLVYKNSLQRYRWALWIVVFSLPVPYIAGQAGWIVTEVGRQPWTVQDMLPTFASISDISAGAVKTTFFIFAGLFTVLLIAEIRIILKQIKLGLKDE